MLYKQKRRKNVYNTLPLHEKKTVISLVKMTGSRVIRMRMSFIAAVYRFLYRWQHARSSRRAECVPTAYSPQYFVSRLCNAANDLCCRCSAWPSESRCTLTLTSNASARSSYTSLYKFNWPWLTFSFSWQCQLSTSLFVLTGFGNSDHADGGQVLEFIQLRSMYLHCSTCGSLEAVCWSGIGWLWPRLAVTSAGRKGSPADWMFRQTTCPKWNAQPRCITPGKTFLTADHTAASKSATTACTCRHFGVRRWVREAHTYNLSCDIATSQTQLFQLPVLLHEGMHGEQLGKWMSDDLECCIDVPRVGFAEQLQLLICC